MTAPHLQTEIDPETGARRLVDRPEEDAVQAYFRDQYYADIAAGEKAVDIKRSAEGGAEADRQRAWMSRTLYADIADHLERFAPGPRVLEIGCGLGDLMTDLAGRGFQPEGVEIAPEAAERARARDLTVHEGAFETLALSGGYDAVLFVNVLEQIADPAAALTRAHDLLAPGGVVLVRSGNDFNPLQIALRDAAGKPEYWVVEDHLWYFTHDSLEALLRKTGFEPVARQSDFPMELLALLGFDFIADRAAGREAHARRVAFEMTVPAETRRRLYRAFAEAGLGRCAMATGRRP